MITKVIDALLIIESLLNDKVRVSAFKNACITHVISLNPVFCANATHTTNWIISAATVLAFAIAARSTPASPNRSSNQTTACRKLH